MEFVLGWIMCGVLSAGFSFAHFQGKFPSIAKKNKREDLGTSLLFGFFGPIALLVALFLSGFGEHGWRLWDKKTPNA